ncbi:hypothetical protein D3C71_308860 [compost metagenome]
MNRRSDARRSGYVTLLAITFAFGLATLGATIAVSARSYLVSATAREHVILDRISLESVAMLALADIAQRGERPLQPVRLPAASINGRSIVTDISIPETKIDLKMDDAETIRKVWPIHPKGAVYEGLATLEAWSRSQNLSHAAEDCARFSLTFGRAPEPFHEILLTEDAPLVSRLASGDQVDLRVHINGSNGRVLWVRARLTGERWSLHDYRMLTRARAQACS